jgi:hypothetical protein
MPIRIIQAWEAFHREPSAKAEIASSVGTIAWGGLAIWDPYVIHVGASWVLPTLMLGLGIAQLLATIPTDARLTRLTLAVCLTVLWPVLLYCLVQLRGLHPYDAGYIAGTVGNAMAAGDLLSFLVLRRFDARWTVEVQGGHASGR